jgi:hypothetical protein
MWDEGSDSTDAQKMILEWSSSGRFLPYSEQQHPAKSGRSSVTLSALGYSIIHGGKVASLLHEVWEDEDEITVFIANGSPPEFVKDDAHLVATFEASS